MKGDWNLTPGQDIIQYNGYSGISGWNNASLDIRKGTVTNNTQNGLALAIIKSLKIELTLSAKSPLTPLFQRGEIPPFDKGRSGGIYLKDVVTIMRPLISGPLELLFCQNSLEFKNYHNANQSLKKCRRFGKFPKWLGSCY